MSAAPTVLGYLREQPTSLAAAVEPLDATLVVWLRRLVVDRRVDAVLFVGSGTSSFAARAVLARAERILPVPVRVAVPTDALHYLPESALGPRTLVIAISQSGSSTGTLECLRRAREAAAPTVLVTTAPSGTTLAGRTDLADLADHVVDIRCGAEDVGAKTKGYTSTLVTLASVVSALAGEDVRPELRGLAATAAATIELADPVVARFADTLDPARLSISIVGSGPNHATALEGALKIIETARVPVDAVEIEEFLHGPHRRLGDDLVLVVLAIGAARERALALVDFAASVAAHILLISDVAHGHEGARRPAAGAPSTVTVLELPGALPEDLSAVTAVIPLQLLAVELSRRLGRPPEDPVFPDFHGRLNSKTVEPSAAASPKETPR